MDTSIGQTTAKNGAGATARRPAFKNRYPTPPRSIKIKIKVVDPPRSFISPRKEKLARIVVVGRWRQVWLDSVSRAEQRRQWMERQKDFLLDAWTENQDLSRTTRKFTSYFAATYRPLLEMEEIRDFMRENIEPFSDYEKMYWWCRYHRLHERRRATQNAKKRVWIRIVNTTKEEVETKLEDIPMPSVETDEDDE